MALFVKLDQAAAIVARLTGTSEFTADNLIDLAKQELLGICFEYRGDIAVISERSPDGVRKNVGTCVRRPKTEPHLEAVPIQN